MCLLPDSFGAGDLGEAELQEPPLPLVQERDAGGVHSHDELALGQRRTWRNKER